MLLYIILFVFGLAGLSLLIVFWDVKEKCEVCDSRLNYKVKFREKLGTGRAVRRTIVWRRCFRCKHVKFVDQWHEKFVPQSGWINCEYLKK